MGSTTKYGDKRTGERGAAAVEFALVVPLLLMLVFGIIDFGYMVTVAPGTPSSAAVAVAVMLACVPARLPSRAASRAALLTMETRFTM